MKVVLTSFKQLGDPVLHEEQQVPQYLLDVVVERILFILVLVLLGVD